MRKLIICEKEYDSVRITAGESAPEQYACGQLQQYLEETYPDAEVEVHEGGQPLYYYIISAE